MAQNKTLESWAYLSTEPAGRREVRYAGMIVLVSFVFFALALPFAKRPLAQFPVFIPIYVTALVICDLVTAALLLGQYRALRARALLVLASGYLFLAGITTGYALIFPGMFKPQGFFGPGPQTSSAMYMFWHAGFPLLVIGYALCKGESAEALERKRRRQPKVWPTIVVAIALVLLVVVSFTAFAAGGHAYLPEFLVNNRTTLMGRSFLLGVWLCGLLALITLLLRKPYAVLDVWMVMVMVAWLLELALAAILNTGRYNLGWYMGRIYGLLAACFLLMVLLGESARQYERVIKASTALARANASLQQISLQDALTDIANRRGFDQYLGHQAAVAARHQRPLALVMVDVDHFKNYNDTYGHVAGDEALKRVAAALQSCCQRSADVAARYGGEEFAMVLPDTDAEGALHIAQSALEAVAALQIPHATCPVGAHLSVSMGVAMLLPGSTMRPGHLVAAADEALYRAKAQGRNRVVCEGREA
jgi:diguanylate cyclase (GGDEF)-like protein